MSVIDEYLSSVPEPQKAVLQHIREFTKQLVPAAEEGLSYGMPAIKHQDKGLIGFIMAKEHLSLFPFSPAVIESLQHELGDYDTSKGTIRFTAQRPISDELLTKVISARLQEINAATQSN